MISPASAHIPYAGVAEGYGINQSTANSKVGMFEVSASPMTHDHVDDGSAAAGRLPGHHGIRAAAAAFAVVASFQVGVSAVR